LPDTGAGSASAGEWERAAAGFDDEPHHGLRDPAVRRAWTDLLRRCLPRRGGRALDVGCGTGSLSLVLAELGFTVLGIDSSPAMLEQAQAKVAAQAAHVTFERMDAARPQLAPAQFDAIVCRHVLWALPEPAQVLGRWAGLLQPKGRLVLIEGRWHTGAGLPPQAVLDALPAALAPEPVLSLSDQDALWGQAVKDERYAITAELS
jgi:SAM-dependent methyltransferase